MANKFGHGKLKLNKVVSKVKEECLLIVSKSK